MTTDFAGLEIKLKELEKRVVKLEREGELMGALYKKAEELVVKNNNASVTFLQRKLLIDLPRAERLIEQLEENGIVEKKTGFGIRKVR